MNISTLVIFTFVASLGGLLSIYVIPLQQATAQVGSSGPQGSTSAQGGSFGSSVPQSSAQGDQQDSEVQKRPPGAGGGCKTSTAANASQGRCIR